MGETTGIQWADHTWNPWKGCQRVSPGCQNCYAEELAKRLGWPWANDPRGEQTAAYWRKPLAWDRKARRDGVRRRVFPSMIDPFEGRRESPFTRFTWLIESTPNLDWLLLTKRPENIMGMVPEHWRVAGFPRNVWLGVSVENQKYADQRIPHLLRCPAAVRVVSYEPALGPVDWIETLANCASDYYGDEVHDAIGDCDLCGGEGVRDYLDSPDEWGEDCPSLKDHLIPCRQCAQVDYAKRVMAASRAGLHLVIVGGESGRKARPFDVGWARATRDACQAAGVAFFMKQYGRNPYAMQEGINDGEFVESWIPLVDPKGGDMSEWAADLRVRQMPFTTEDDKR